MTMDMYRFEPKSNTSLKSWPLFVIGTIILIGSMLAPERYWTEVYIFGACLASVGFGLSLAQWDFKIRQMQSDEEIWNQYNLGKGTWERVDV